MMKNNRQHDRALLTEDGLLNRDLLNREELIRRLSEAEDVVAALASGQVDAVVDPKSGGILLLQEAQQALQVSERQFRAVFQGALDAIVVTDDEGRYVDANPAACALFGLPREDLLTRRVSDFAVPDHPITDDWQQFRGANTEARSEFSLRRPDGTIRHTQYAATPNILPGRHLSLLHDITERKRSERELHALNQTLERRNSDLLLLHEISLNLGSTLDLHELYHRLYDIAQRMFGTPHFVVACLDVTQRAVTCQFAIVDGEEMDPSCFPPLPLGSGPTSETLRLRRPQIVDLEAVHNALPAERSIHIGDERQPRSALYVPLISANGPIGVFNIQSYEANAFDDEDLTLLSILANQAAVAIENARLFTQSQQELEERRRAEADKEKTLHLLRERVKEQILLQQTARLLNTYEGSPAALLQDLVDLLPVAWQHATVAAARLRFDGNEATTPGFAETAWRQWAAFQTLDGRMGSVEVVYLAERPEEDEGPFLAEERDVLNSVADMVGGHFNRVLAEESLRQSQARLAGIVDSAMDAIVTADDQERIVLFNGAAERIFGYAADEIRGESLDRLFPARQQATYRRHLETASNFPGTARDLAGAGHFLDGRRASGQEFPVDASFSQVEVSGQMFSTLILRDVTERRQREQEREAIARTAMELRTAQTRDQVLAALLAQVDELLQPDASAIIMQDAANKALVVELAGGELAGATGALLPPDFRFTRRIFETGERFWSNDPALAPAMAAAVRPLPHLPGMVAVPLIAQEKTIGVVGAARRTAITAGEVQLLSAVADIAASAIYRSTLYEQLQDQAGQMHDLVDTLADGLVLLDRDKTIKLANPAGISNLATLANAVIGEQLVGLAGWSMGELLAPPADGAPGHKIQSASGAAIYEVNAHAMGNKAEPSGWVLVLRDVTEERKRQQWMAQQEQLAAVGQLAAGIAHDFNNIMSAIILYTQILQKRLALTEADHDRFATVQGQAHHAVALVRQLLDFSRRSLLERSTVDLVPFCKELAKMLERILPETMELAFDYDHNQYFVSADPTRLQQALINLALNARDAMPQGGTLHLALSHATVTPDAAPPIPEMDGSDWLCLEVADNGDGVQPEHLAHLFEPFFTTKEEGKGTGLGLAQVYGIVKQHDGHISVDSVVGQGTRFRIYLPLLTDPQIQPATEPMLASTVQADATILLVEDNAATRAAFQEALTSAGYWVLAAEGGPQALALFAQHPVDLVLSDMVMPTMSGLDLYQMLKSRQPDVKMIIVSGYPLEDDGRLLQEEGIVAWYQKPLGIDELLLNVAAALGQTG